MYCSEYRQKFRVSTPRGIVEETGTISFVSQVLQIVFCIDCISTHWHADPLFNNQPWWKLSLVAVQQYFIHWIDFQARYRCHNIVLDHMTWRPSSLAIVCIELLVASVLVGQLIEMYVSQTAWFVCQLLVGFLKRKREERWSLGQWIHSPNQLLQLH